MKFTALGAMSRAVSFWSPDHHRRRLISDGVRFACQGTIRFLVLEENPFSIELPPELYGYSGAGEFTRKKPRRLPALMLS